MSTPAEVVAGPLPLRQEDSHHHALEQLPGLDYRINDSPSIGTAIVLGFQHYLTMIYRYHGAYSNTNLSGHRGEAHDLAKVVQSALLVSAINTLVQTFFGTRLPVVMGNSFYFLPRLLSIVNRDIIINIPDPLERFKRGMRATEGAFIAGSAVSILLGFSGFWRIFMRYISPIVIAPVTTMVGLGLFERDFRGLKTSSMGSSIGARVIVTFIVATVLDVTLTRHTGERDRGMLWARKFRYFGHDPRNYELKYRLPMGLNSNFPPR